MKKVILSILTVLAIGVVAVANTFNVNEYYQTMKTVQKNNGGYVVEGYSYAGDNRTDFKIYTKDDKFRVEKTIEFFGKPSKSTAIFDGKELYTYRPESNYAYKDTKAQLMANKFWIETIFNWNGYGNVKFDYVYTGEGNKNGMQCKMLKATYYASKDSVACVSDKYGILVHSDGKNPSYKATVDITKIEVGDTHTPPEAFMLPKGMEIRTY